MSKGLNDLNCILLLRLSDYIGVALDASSGGQDPSRIRDLHQRLLLTRCSISLRFGDVDQCCFSLKESISIAQHSGHQESLAMLHELTSSSSLAYHDISDLQSSMLLQRWIRKICFLCYLLYL